MTSASQACSTIALHAWEADVIGKTANYESGWGLDNIGNWTDPKDYVEWSFRSRNAGRYKVELTYACKDESAGSEFTISVADSAASGKIDGTGAWNKFKSVTLGEIPVGAGPQKLIVKATTKPNEAVMNLQRVRLLPVN